MTPHILLLNGPNLNLLGQRQPEIYGHTTLADVENAATEQAQKAWHELAAKQSNWEGQIVDWIQQARSEAAAIIINPGAYSHTSIAILDALNAFDGLVAEVHVSDIHKREAFRHHSYVSHRADKIVIGEGVEGYRMALDWVIQNLGDQSSA